MALNFSGMMQGMGAGVSQYGNIYADQIKQKRDQDFRSQEAKLQGEREEARQERQLSAQSKESALGREFQGEQNELSRGLQQQQIDISRASQQSQSAYQGQMLQNAAQELQMKIADRDLAAGEFVDENGRTLKKSETDGMSQEQLAKLKTKDMFKGEQSLSLAEKTYQKTKGLEQGERDRIADAAQKQLMKDGTLSTSDELTLMSIRTGVSLKEIMGTKETRIEPAVFNKIMESIDSDEKYSTLPVAEKISLASYLYSTQIGGGTSPANVRTGMLTGQQEGEAVPYTQAQAKGNKVPGVVEETPEDRRQIERGKYSSDVQIRRENPQNPNETDLAYKLRIKKLQNQKG